MSMSSIEVLVVDENGSLSSCPSDEFSMLPEVSCHNGENSAVHRDGNTNLHSSSIVENGLEKIESNFSEILRENFESLKSDLNSNHTLMRHQMKTILEWRERMLADKKRAAETFAALQQENMMLHQRIKELQNMNLKAEENEMIMHCKIEDLTKKSESTEAVEAERAELWKQFENLKVDFTLLEKQHEKCKEHEDTKVEQLMEKIDHLTAHLLDCQGKLKDQEEEIKELVDQLSMAKDENKIIPIQESQIKIFKEDLEEAISTRDKAYGEIRKLENELKKYRRPSCDSGFPSLWKRSQADLVCPVCESRFRHKKEIEEHVERCIDNNQ